MLAAAEAVPSQDMATAKGMEVTVVSSCTMEPTEVDRVASYTVSGGGGGTRG